MTCYNINDPSVKAIIDYYGGRYTIAASVIDSWQKLNNTDAIPMISDLESTSFNRNKNITSNSYFSVKKPDVILPIGTSGSGKSTFIKSLPQDNLVVIEPDAMRVEFTGDMNNKSKDNEIYIEAANRAIEAIKKGKQVVFDTTNLTKEKRRPFIEAIKKAIPNANIQYKLMELNPELAKQRIKAQLERGENRAVVSDKTIDRHSESYKQMLEDIKNEPITEYKEIGLNQSSVVKPGVDELFSSNPELVNQVYKALGFNQTLNIPEYEVVTRPTNKGIGETKGATGNRIEITTPDEYRQNMSGYLIQSNNSGKLFITNIEKYNDDSTFKGFGTVAYIDFFENYKNKPQGITTDTKLTSDGIKLLERLEKIGLVYKTDAKLIDDTQISKVFKSKIYEYDKPLYEFNYNWTKNQITPQQEQQAKQLYSSYLDSIFPESQVKDIVYHGSSEKINQFEIRKEPLIHFGSKNAALQRGDVLNQVLLNIKNLQTIKDGMWFLGTDKGGLLKELFDRNILSIEQVKSINEAKNKAIQQSPYFNENYRMALPEGEKAGNEKLQALLSDKNIGFEYINFSEDKGSTSFAVSSQEQIHILGSKQDIEGFKRFVSKPTSGKTVFESRELKMERFNFAPKEYIVDRTTVGKKTLINILDNLKSKFGIDYVIDPTLESKGAFKNGKVYINPNSFTLDTPFHEYAHPFLMYVKQKNPGLYNQLAEEIKKDSLLMGIIKKTYSDKSEDEQIDEAIVTKLGKLAQGLSSSPKYKSILDRIFEFISNAISKLMGKSIKLDLNTTLHDLATMLVDETRAPLEFIDFEEGVFESRESDFIESRAYFKSRDFGNMYAHIQKLSDQGLNTTQLIDTLNKLHKIAVKVEKNPNPVGEESRYVVNGSTDYKGTTDWIESFAPEKSIKIFKGDPTESVGVKYGNAVDMLLDIITQSYTYDSNYKLEDYEDLDLLSEYISNEFGIDMSVPEIKFLTSQILKIFDKYPKHVFVSQMSVYNSSEKVVGTTDLLAIDPETGTVNIVDLKLSAKSVSSDSLKLNRYKYQVSTYGAMYKSRNVPVGDLSLYEIQRYDDADKRFGYGKFVDISPLKDVEQHFNVYNDVNENKQNKKLINKVKVILEKELRKAKRNKNAYGVKKYNDLKTALQNISVGESVNNFIKSAYTDIIGKPYVQNGIHKISTKYSDKGKFETLNEQHKNGQLDDKTYVEELFKMKKDLELYEPILFELMAIAKDLEREGDDTSRELRDAIADIIQFKREFINEYKSSVIPSIANELVKNLDMNKLMSQSNKNLTILENRLAKYKAGNASESKIQSLEKEIQDLKDSTPSYEKVVKQLEEGFDKDLSYFQTSLIDTISSHNDIISLYVLKVKAFYENINQELFKSQPEFDSQYDAFKRVKSTSGSPKQVYDSMMEKTIFSADGGWGEDSHMEDYGFIRDRKYDDWMKSFAELNKQCDELEDKSKVKQLREKWYLANCESAPNTNRNYYNKALNKDVTLEYGVDYLLKEIKKDFLLKANQDAEKAEKDYNQWLKDRTITKPDGSTIIMDIRFVKPVKSIYNNSKYESLQRSSQFEYYQFLLSTVLGSRVSTSNRYNLDYRIPSVPATTLTKLSDSGIKTSITDGIKSFTQATPEDKIEYGDSFFIGDPFQNKLEDKDRTFNLTEISKMFYKESLVRKVRRDIELFSLGLLDVVGETEVNRTSGGKTIIDRAKEALLKEGLDISAADTISGKESDIYKVLNELIETLVYGRTRESGNEKLMQVTKSLAKLASTTQIGGLNVVPAIAQNLQQSAMAAVEAWAGTNLSKESLLWARTQEVSIAAELAKDLAGDGTKKSKIGQLIQAYNIFQGDFFDSFGRKLKGENVANMVQSNPAFFLQKVANEMPLIRTFLAYLKDTKVDTANGQISLWDAYELDKTSRIKIKDGVKLKNYGDFKSDLVDGAAMKKFHSIVKGMGESKGLINNPLIKRKWYGNALMFYRNWVMPGIKKRFDSVRYDKEEESYKVGSYRAFWKKLWNKDFKSIIHAIGKNKGDLTDYEYAALRHAFFEQSAILLTSVLATILASMLAGADDEDEKKRLQYALYFTQRLNSEMSFFGGLGNVDTAGLPNVSDTLRMFKQPTFLSSYVMNTAKLMYQFTNPFEVYKRDYGMFEKGDSKLYAKFLKLFGVSGTQMHPEDLLKILTLSTAS